MARPGTTTAVGAGAGGATSAGTRERLVAAAIDALREVGFHGASAREIARRASSNQGLVFYHFGSVGNLLLAALDEVSRQRLGHYRDAVEGARGIRELVDVAQGAFQEDLDAGHVRVLVEMIAGASSVPGLGDEIARRLEPWRALAADAISRGLAGSGLLELLPAESLAHGVLALYLGLEMLAGVEADRTMALGLFGLARTLAGFIVAGDGDGDGDGAGSTRAE